MSCRDGHSADASGRTALTESGTGSGPRPAHGSAAEDRRPLMQAPRAASSVAAVRRRVCPWPPRPDLYRTKAAAGRRRSGPCSGSPCASSSSFFLAWKKAGSAIVKSGDCNASFTEGEASACQRQGCDEAAHFGEHIRRLLKVRAVTAIRHQPRLAVAADLAGDDAKLQLGAVFVVLA